MIVVPRSKSPASVPTGQVFSRNQPARLRGTSLSAVYHASRLLADQREDHATPSTTPATTATP